MRDWIDQMCFRHNRIWSRKSTKMMIILIKCYSFLNWCAHKKDLDGLRMQEPKDSSPSGIALAVWMPLANLVTRSQVVHITWIARFLEEVFALFKNLSGFLSDSPNIVPYNWLQMFGILFLNFHFVFPVPGFSNLYLYNRRALRNCCSVWEKERWRCTPPLFA